MKGKQAWCISAFDTAIERTVAIKCLRTGTPGRRAGKREQPDRRSLRGSQSDWPVEPPSHYRRFRYGHRLAMCPYIVMEYVQGETLKSRLAQSQTDRASVPQILSFIVMVARALHYVHQRGILHGDIKPANIIVTPSGTPKIMDFGVARRSLDQQARRLVAGGRETCWGYAGLSGTGNYSWGTQLTPARTFFHWGSSPTNGWPVGSPFGVTAWRRH